MDQISKIIIKIILANSGTVKNKTFLYFERFENLLKKNHPEGTGFFLKGYFVENYNFCHFVFSNVILF